MTHETFTMTRTVQAVARGAKQVEGEFGPDRPENLADIVDRLMLAMEKLGYPEDMSERAKRILRELGENALVHGCRGNPDIRARARCLVGPSYVRIVVEDDGPGFDFHATLERLKQKASGPDKRGRGIRLVEKLADHLRHSRSGNRIEAVIRREAVKLRIQVPSRTEYDFHEDIVIVKLAGSLDSSNLPDVEKLLDTLVMEGWTRIVLNVEEVDYISSLGVGVFLRFQSKLQSCAGLMVLAAPSQPIRGALDSLGLSSVIPIVPSVKDAIEHLT
jgi:anti-sigma B factor antagonist